MEVRVTPFFESKHSALNINCLLKICSMKCHQLFGEKLRIKVRFCFHKVLFIFGTLCYVRIKQNDLYVNQGAGKFAKVI